MERLKSLQVRLAQGTRRVTLRVLNARYSISTWLWILVSLLAAIVMFLQLLAGGPSVVAFLDSLPMDGYLFTVGLIVTGLLKLYGMARDQVRLVKYGAFGAFLFWVFGLVTFLDQGQLTTIILLIIPILLVNSYLFLGATFRERPGA